MTELVDSNTLSKWRKLVHLLVSLTNKGKLSWKETPRDDEFLTSHGSNVVVIRQSSSQTSFEDLFLISLRDKEGKIIDSFNDETLDHGQDETNYYVLIRDLMLTIRRSLSGADQALDELLASLSEEDDDLPPF